jgi:hypothetical protein
MPCPRALAFVAHSLSAEDVGVWHCLQYLPGPPLSYAGCLEKVRSQFLSLRQLVRVSFLAIKPNSSGDFSSELRTLDRQTRPIILRKARFSPKLWTPPIRYGSRNLNVLSYLSTSRERGSISPSRGSNPPAAASHSAFQRISFFGSRKARQWRAFLIVESLQLRRFRIFSAKNPESLQPNSIKLPFSGDSPWRR